MDKDILTAINNEQTRQDNHIELIASENFVSKDILELVGSCLTNKYAEGYPAKRYYGGCQYVDDVENLAIKYAKELFNAEHVNVQPHCGSSTNMAVYMTVLEPGDKVLGMDLAAGGHLTHGHPLSFSGKLYNFYSYGVDPKTEMIDYDNVLEIAKQVKPKLIVAGASAYSREIDFKKFRAIADEVGAYLLTDMAHIAGLVEAGLHMSPVPYCDFVTSTTHKTLRGPRGGIVICKEKYAKDLDRTVFPGIQGGPLMHVIAGKAQCFYEALQPEFKEYAQNISGLFGKGRTFAERKQALYSMSHNEDGTRNLGKLAASLTNAVSDMAKQLNSKIDEIGSYKSVIDTRLYGSKNTKN